MPTKDISRAVIVADTFDSKFEPISLTIPTALLPLANVPLIEYSLETLALSGVVEILIICCSHSLIIKEYIDNSKWAKASLPAVKVIISLELRSLGDALRELDEKQLLDSEFILVSGFSISNIDLSIILNEHRNRKVSDKNSIMTIILKNACANHSTKSKAQYQVFGMDAQTRELLYYQHSPSHKKDKIKIPVSTFRKHNNLILHNDMIDCQISICSIEVLALFSENFDYQDVRQDFLRGILESDILGKSIYCHVLDTEYAAEVSTLQTYDAVSKDVLARWSYPFTPDAFFLNGEKYTHSIHNIYKGDSIELDRTVILTESVIIGANTIIKHNSTISRSVIGRNCVIGSNVNIVGSYILDNVTIYDNCSITQSLVGSNTIILDNVIIQSSCFIDCDVTLGPDVNLRARTGVSSHKPVDQISDGHEDLDEILGVDHIAYLYVRDDSLSDTEHHAHIYLGDTSADEFLDEYMDSDLDSNEDSLMLVVAEQDWIKEIEQTISRAFAEEHTIEIAALELNTLKMAMNIRFIDLRQIVIPQILSLVKAQSTQIDVNQILERWFPILSKFTFTRHDQLDCLNVTTAFLLKHPSIIPLTSYIFKSYYDVDVIEEDAVISWYDNLDGAVRELKTIRDAAAGLVNWLRDAEVESDDESDSESNGSG